MKLLEVGNAVQPYELTNDSLQYKRYSFYTTDNEKYEVVFMGAPIDPIDIVELFPGATDETFNERNKLEKGANWIPVLKEAQRRLPTFISYDVTFCLRRAGNEEDDYIFSATNKGGKTVFEVFATVKAIILEFMTTCEDYDCLIFSAEEPSRQKLYDHFADAIEQYAHLAQIRGPGYAHESGQGPGSIHEKEYVLFDPESLK